MILKKLKAGGLSQNTYFVSSGSDAAVIDPRREPGDIQACLDLAQENCARIRYVFETHRNEDFVHGSLELQSLTDATIYHSARLPFKYGDPVSDGEEVPLGRLNVRVVETPGHTDESLTFVLYDSRDPGIALAAFTGDALFVGSTGRVDLPGEDKRQENAGKLYDSIREKILALGDQLLLCPAHGAGSVCGAGMGDRDWSTVGYEKCTNPHLQLGRDEFVEYKAGEVFVRPPYFRQMESFNLHGPPAMGLRPDPTPMGVRDFEAATCMEDIAIVDVRLPQAFAGGHIPGSYNIWLEGMALFPGWMFSRDTGLLIVPYYGDDIRKADRMLCRIGYDRMAGYLCGGFEDWQNQALPIGYTGALHVDALKPLLDTSDIRLVDVREPREWQEGVVPGALLNYVGDLKEALPDMPHDHPVAVMCSVGHRGSLGASILQRAGFTKVYNVPGGFTAWKRKGYPFVKYSSGSDRIM